MDVSGRAVSGIHRAAKIGVLDALAPRFAHTDSVRSALALVESGAADYAFVYETDVAVATRAKVVWTDAAGVGPKVRYFAAVVRGSTTPAAAGYVAFLKAAPFQEAARAKGFAAP